MEKSLSQWGLTGSSARLILSSTFHVFNEFFNPFLKPRFYYFKAGGKSPKSIHLLEVAKITATSETEFEIVGRNTPSLIVATVKTDIFLKQFCSSWSDAFPGITPPIETNPKERLGTIFKKKKKLGPCYNLVKTYNTLSNYLRVAPQTETTWILLNIIAERKIRTYDPNLFNFKDLSDFKAFTRTSSLFFFSLGK